MKQHTTWIATVIGGLACAISAQAQPVTGDALLDNISPTAAYPNWNTTAVVTDTPAGVNVTGLAAYGSAYFAIPANEQQVINPNVTYALATLVMTINNVPQGYPTPGTPASSLPPGDSGYWVGIPFILDDNVESQTYGGYTGEFGSFNIGATSMTSTWNGDTVTETVPLDALQNATILAGGDVINAFNLEFDPAVFPTGFESITFNSLTISSAPDGASTMTLLGSAAAVLFSFRRRNK